MKYVARDGKVYVDRNGRLTERTTAVTANGTDVARFEAVRQQAQRQRECEQPASGRDPHEPMNPWPQEAA